MSIHHYIGGTGWTSGGTEVTVEFPTVPELTTAARGGEGGSGSVIVTDPTGTLDLRGWNRYRAEETACTTRPLIYPGFVKGKKVRRGAEGPRGVGRVWECELGDLNLLAHLVAFKTADANRPAETFATRIAWFLASSVVSGLFSDTGYVITGHDSVALDAADYRRRYPDDVTGDISSQTGWDWFIFWDYTAAAPSLFLNLRDAAILTSSLSISNFAGEADDTTVFSSGHSSETEDAVNERDPDETYSAVDLYGVGVEAHRASATTAAAYITRSYVYESTRIGRQATADAVADQFISDHSIEADTLTIPVRLPKSLVNMITAGERIAVHFEHLHFTSGTDYGGAGYVYVRVARRTVSQAELDFYDLTLTCTNFVRPALAGGGGTGGFPHPPPGPASVIQTGCGFDIGGTVALVFPNPISAGHVLVAWIVSRGSSTFLSPPDGSWTTLASGDLSTGLSQSPAAMYAKIADSTEDGQSSLAFDSTNGSSRPKILGWELDAGMATHVVSSWIQTGSSGSLPSLTMDGAGINIIGIGTGSDNPEPASITPEDDFYVEAGDHLWQTALGADDVVSAAGSQVYSFAFTVSGGGALWDGAAAFFPGTAATTNPPEPGQWVYNEVVTLTGGAGTTEFPFADRSLHVRYDIIDQTPAIVSYDGAAGTFQMPSQPPLGTQVFVDYQGR